VIRGNQRSLSLCVHAIIVSVALATLRRRFVNPNQLSVAPTKASRIGVVGGGDG
jgi:hypothetical protein